MIDDQRNNWSTSPAIVDRQAREPSCPSLRSHMLESFVKIARLSSDSDARKRCQRLEVIQRDRSGFGQ
jgi:hypothetical protein